MNRVLSLKKSNCKNCYKCIRNCPVKSIKFEDGQAHILPDECILCGRCFVACPQDAKQLRSDVERVRQAIAEGRTVIASVAPSFIAEFPLFDFAAMRRALMQLGFADAEETAIGATIVKNEYQKLVAAGEMDVIISTCCHTVNALIQKYYPGALHCLAPVLSPMQAHCKAIKEVHPDAMTVFIGPCISKKEESDIYGITDVALTFEEVEGWMEEAGVSAASAEKPQDTGKRGRFFPVTGGIIRSMDTENTGYTYIAVDGVENCHQGDRGWQPAQGVYRDERLYRQLRERPGHPAPPPAGHSGRQHEGGRLCRSGGFCRAGKRGSAQGYAVSGCTQRPSQ